MTLAVSYYAIETHCLSFYLPLLSSLFIELEQRT